MGSKALTVDLRLAFRDSSPEELEELTRSIREQLLEHPIERVDLVRGASRLAGTKAADPVTLGAIALVVLPTVLPKVVELLKQLTTRKDGLTFELNISEGDRRLEFKLPATPEAERQLQALLREAKKAISR
jgi:hypothetical protein